MTARELYQNALIEINKLQAPALLLEDYNYFINKAVQQYINKVYNRYDINQQSTDDLRVLSTDTTLSIFSEPETMFDKRSITELPSDYLHLLNCVVEFESYPQKLDKCGDVISVVREANKLTADTYPMVLRNAYMKPSYNNPY